MPTYQYACPDCGLEFERVQKFTDDPVKVCPKCRKKKVYRVVSKVAVSFKGSGWYITDSKRNNTNGTAKKDDKVEEKSNTTTETAAKAETTSETATESKADTKADSTPDSKSESKNEKKPAKKKAD
jgi:putative FmdB family regulatory protein